MASLGSISPPPSQPGPDLPQLREEAALDGGAQVAHPRGAPGAGTGADGTRRHQRVAEAPDGDRLVVVAEQLGDAVQGAAAGAAGVVSVELGEDGEPPLPGLVAVGEVEPLGAGAGAERLPTRGTAGGGARPRRGGRRSGDAAAEALDGAELRRLEAGRRSQGVAEGE